MSGFFHSPSKKMRHRFWTSVGRRCACLKKETTFSNVSGFKLAAASFCLIGAARRVLPAKKAIIVSQDFIFLAAADSGSARSRLGTTKTGQDACRTIYSAVLPRR